MSPLFELERFEWTAPGRIELAGRWSEVRARRFMRPTLTLEGDGEQYRLLALLEHKPWAPEDEQQWIAAFAWEGEPGELDSAHLAVATGVEVTLPPPATIAKPAKARKKNPTFRAGDAPAAEPAPAAPADPRIERERAHAAQLMRDRDLAIAAREGREEELEQARQERDAARAELEPAAQARDDALRERDAAASDRDALKAELEAARAELDTLRAERDTLRAERDAMRGERDAMRTERDASKAARDAIAGERNAIASERDATARERDRAMTRRVAPSPITPASGVSPMAVWAPRLVALGVLVALVAALAVLLRLFG
jgi:hypothetical protein